MQQLRNPTNPVDSKKEIRVPEAIGAIRRFRKNLRALEREIDQSLASETGCCGVTMAQCHLLLEVAERGVTNITELSDSLELDKSTLSRTVDALWSAGLLNRETAPSNRRRQVISLTEKGREKTQAIDRLCDDSYDRLFRYIPRDMRSQVPDVVAVLADAMRRKRRLESSACSRPIDGPRGQGGSQ
jgi:DNA-binding MarR family transcriptional regulator